ncbi:tetratricopeptide repeat (TPR)-like superfamily protein isoform X2 [Wolffia australiana]
MKYLSSHRLDEESPPSATSEKELGNEYFKKKDFSKAIECYSRSIALSPNSVAYANRAMSYIKLKRYEEAEADCTEALNLDDRYVKAYSRRATARKELGKLKSSLEDSEFALRLEPANQELKKLFAETKALYDDELSREKSNDLKGTDKPIPPKKISEIGRKTEDKQTASHPVVDLPSEEKRKYGKKGGQNVPARDLASRAVSLAASAIPEKISTPKTAYEFEVSWRLLSGDSAKQANLLKSIPPPSLPHLFKNALSAPMLFEIVKSTSTFFKEEMELALEILDGLTKVPRFDILVICMPPENRDALRRIWEEVFADAVPKEHTAALLLLRRRYSMGA